MMHKWPAKCRKCDVALRFTPKRVLLFPDTARTRQIASAPTKAELNSRPKGRYKPCNGPDVLVIHPFLVQNPLSECRSALHYIPDPPPDGECRRASWCRNRHAHVSGVQDPSLTVSRGPMPTVSVTALAAATRRPSSPRIAHRKRVAVSQRIRRATRPSLSVDRGAATASGSKAKVVRCEIRLAPSLLEPSEPPHLTSPLLASAGSHS